VTLAARTFGQAAYLSLYEFFTVYTPRGYVVSWIPRIVLQLAFFYWMAGFIGGSDLRVFILIGTTAQMCAHAILVFATQGVGRELALGTMVLLIATPARPIVVLLGRSLAMAGNGLVTAAIGIAATVYGLAMLVASVTLRYPTYQNAASNLVGLAMIVLCGVTVPIEVLPEPLQALSYAVPLTYGLAALRAVLAGAGPQDLIAPIALALASGAAYFALASVSFAHFLDRARARGTLDFH
jgi:ABC-2 type transport system permease protein